MTFHYVPPTYDAQTKFIAEIRNGRIVACEYQVDMKHQWGFDEVLDTRLVACR